MKKIFMNREGKKLVCVEEREDSSSAEMLSLRDVGVQPTPVHSGLWSGERKREMMGKR